MGVGLGVALLVAEGALRIFGHEGPIYTFRDAQVGRRFLRSWAGEVYVEEARAVVPMAFNREGMRDRDWPEAPGSERRVAVLGDSMVAGLGVAQPFPARAGTGVMNWGVPGSSPALELRLYEQRVRRYRPALVVLVWFDGNDLADDWQPLGGRRQAWMGEDAAGQLVHLPLAESSSAVSEWLARHSRFYVWQKRVLARLRGNDGDASLRPGLRAFDVSANPEVERAWHFQGRVLERFASVVAADGAQFAVLHLPTPETVHDDLWAQTLRRGAAEGWSLEREACERRLRALCEQHGLSFRSLAPALRARARAQPPQASFFGRQGHLDDEGHALVAQELRSWIQDLMERPR